MRAFCNGDGGGGGGAYAMAKCHCINNNVGILWAIAQWATDIFVVVVDAVDVLLILGLNCVCAIVRACVFRVYKFTYI